MPIATKQQQHYLYDQDQSIKSTFQNTTTTAATAFVSIDPDVRHHCCHRMLQNFQLGSDYETFSQPDQFAIGIKAFVQNYSYIDVYQDL